MCCVNASIQSCTKGNILYHTSHLCDSTGYSFYTFLGSLFPELVSSTLLLHTSFPDLFLHSSVMSKLENMIDIIDRFNQLSVGASADDSNDLAWPGMFSKHFSIGQTVDWLITQMIL